MVYCYSMTLDMQRLVERTDIVAAASSVARELFADNPAPALSLAVASGGGVIWCEALGKADLEQDVPCTPDHLFRLGSVSKPVTAPFRSIRALVTSVVPCTIWVTAEGMTPVLLSRVLSPSRTASDGS